MPDQIVTKVITWKRTTSSKSSSSRNPLAMKDDDDSGSEYIDEFCMISGSHSSTLDRLYAWERKLYDEVKVLELLPTCRMINVCVILHFLPLMIQYSELHFSFYCICIIFCIVYSSLTIYNVLIIQLEEQSRILASLLKSCIRLGAFSSIDQLALLAFH